MRLHPLSRAWPPFEARDDWSDLLHPGPSVFARRRWHAREWRKTKGEISFRGRFSRWKLAKRFYHHGRNVYEVTKRAAFTTVLATDDENPVQLGNNRHETGFYVITLPIVRTIALLFMGQRDRFSNDDLPVTGVVFTTENLWKENRWKRFLEGEREILEIFLDRRDSNIIGIKKFSNPPVTKVTAIKIYIIENVCLSNYKFAMFVEIKKKYINFILLRTVYCQTSFECFIIFNKYIGLWFLQLCYVLFTIFLIYIIHSTRRSKIVVSYDA